MERATDYAKDDERGGDLAYPWLCRVGRREGIVSLAEEAPSLSHHRPAPPPSLSLSP